jgi:hypothetical protein
MWIYIFRCRAVLLEKKDTLKTWQNRMSPLISRHLSVESFVEDIASPFLHILSPLSLRPVSFHSAYCDFSNARFSNIPLGLAHSNLSSISYFFVRPIITSKDWMTKLSLHCPYPKYSTIYPKVKFVWIGVEYVYWATVGLGICGGLGVGVKHM